MDSNLSWKACRRVFDHDHVAFEKRVKRATSPKSLIRELTEEKAYRGGAAPYRD